MVMRNIVTLCSALALAACGSGADDADNADSATITINTQQGQSTIQTGPNADVTLPAGFTVYPGANVISNVTADFGEGAQTTLTLQTSASLATVAAFYKKQASAAGVNLATDMTTPESVMLGGETPAGTVFGLIAAPSENGGTTVNLSLQGAGQ